MALPCPICKEPIHWKMMLDEEGKERRVLYRCPLAPFKFVKMYYTKNIHLLGTKFPKHFSLSDSPAAIENFSKVVPEKTDLMKYVTVEKSGGEGLSGGKIDVVLSPLRIEAKEETFFLHFTRVLIDLFEKNPDLRYVNAEAQPTRSQFNYFYLPPQKLKEAYFNEVKDADHFSSLTSMLVPNLLIYPIGSSNVEFKGWGDVLLGVLQNRSVEGKASWLLDSHGLHKSTEIKTSDRLLSHINDYPKVVLDELAIGGDPYGGCSDDDEDLGPKSPVGSYL